jgi:hypothetical protein
MAFEAKLLLGIVLFVAFISFLTTISPPEYQIMSAFDLAILGGGFLLVGGACAIATGIPCAAALIVFGVIDLVHFTATPIFLLSSDIGWFKAIILTPISLILLYLAVRLARGGG